MFEQVPPRQRLQQQRLALGNMPVPGTKAGAVVSIGLVWALVHYVELMTSEFAVTNSRLILKVGLISRYTTELLLTKVETIGVQQGLLARVLGYGDLVVTGTGGAREVFHRVRDPIGFRNHVQQASLGTASGQIG